ncbi:hypothetical protein D9M71_581490 [compost metagenome]
MAADLDVNRGVAQAQVLPDKGIEDFPRRAFDVAFYIRAIAVVVVTGLEAGDVTVHIIVVIRLVIPAGCAQTRAPILFVGKVDFSQQVETVGDDVVLVELTVRFIVVGVVHDAPVLPFRTHPQGVARGIIPTQMKVRVGQFDGRRHRRTAVAKRQFPHCQQDHRPPGPHAPLFAYLFHANHLLFLLSVAFSAPGLSGIPASARWGR